MKIDKNKVQVKYITGINKCVQNYPTPLDVLYDSCIESVDDSLFSSAKMENRYEIDESKIENIIKVLLDSGYIEQDDQRYKIINTPWH